MVEYFTGKSGDATFVAAHALIEHERIVASAAVDSLSGKYGSNLPDLSPTGWVIRKVAPEILPPSIVSRLENASPGHVHNVGEVALSKIEMFVGADQIAKAFAPPEEESIGTDLEAA